MKVKWKFIIFLKNLLTVLWVVTPCNDAIRDQSYRQLCCLYLQGGGRVSQPKRLWHESSS